MNREEIIERWVELLETGNLEQCVTMCCKYTGTEQPQYCVIGVLWLASGRGFAPDGLPLSETGEYVSSNAPYEFVEELGLDGEELWTANDLERITFSRFARQIQAGRYRLFE